MPVSPELRPLLRATVIDVGDFTVSTPAVLVVDANVLMFSTYGRYDQQRLLGQGAPAGASVSAYLRYEQRARAAGGNLCVTPSVTWEFLRTIEMAELRILWARLDAQAGGGDFTDFNAKRVRRMAGHGYRDVQDRVVAYADQLTRRFRLSGRNGDLAGMMTGFADRWLGSIADPGDALLASEARAAGVEAVLSDDQDLATIDGVVLFTANPTAIDTARDVGRLRSGRTR